MKLRNWALTLGGLFILGSIAVFLGKDFINNSDYVRQLIQDEAGLQIGEVIGIQSAEIGFGHIKLDNLGFSFGEDLDSLNIKELRIGWSAVEFIKSFFKPTKGVTEVKIIEPQLILTSNTNPKSISEYENLNFLERRDYLIDKIERTTKEFLASFQNISQIVIEKGNVIYIDKSKNNLSIAGNVNGSLYLGKSRPANLALRAKLLNSSSENLVINVNLDFDQGYFVSDLVIRDYDLSFGLPNRIYDNIDIEQGKLNAHIQIVNYSDSLSKEKYDVKGEFEVNNLFYSLFDNILKVENTDISGKINQSDIIIENFVQRMDAGEFEINGVIKNIFSPTAELNLNLNDIDISKMQDDSLMIFDKDLSGKISGSLFLSGPVRSLLIDGQIFSDTLRFGLNEIYDVNTDIALEYPYLSINDLSTDFRNNEILLDVDYDFSKPDSVDVRGLLKGDLISLLTGENQLKNNNYFGEAEFDISGTFSNLKGGGLFDIRSINEKGIRTVQGEIILDDDIILMGKTSDHSSEISGTFKRDFSAYNVEIYNALPILMHEVEMPENFDYNTSAILNLNIDNIDNDTDLLVTALSNTEDTIFVAEVNYFSETADRSYLMADISIPLSDEKSFTVSSEITKQENRYIIRKIKSPGIFSGSGEIVDSEDMKIVAQIDIDADIAEINRLFNKDYLNNGYLSGKVILGGNINNPRIAGNIDLINGMKNGLSDITGFFKFNSESWTSLIAEDLQIFQGGYTILEGSGDLNIGNSLYELSLNGDKLPSEIYMALFANNSNIVDGDIDYNLVYSNNGSVKDITGSLIMESGRIGIYDVYDLSATLDKLPEDIYENEDIKIKLNGIFPKLVNISECSVTIFDSIPVIGNGSVSLSDEINSDFDVTLNGNILSILTSTDDFFKSAASSGEANINFGGNLKNPVFSSGQLVIQSGILEIESVFKNFEDINISAELAEGDRFIKFDNFDLKIDGKEARITNEREVLNEQISLIPLEIMDDGLNIGVLSIETSDKGIDINIPGIIPKNETGNIKTSGLNDGENFYFAGGDEEIDNHYVRGKIYVRDSHISYPEIELDENPEPLSLVERYISNLFWDLNVIPENDNFYVRSDPISYIPLLNGVGGDVEVELKIEDEDEGLQFLGVISEDSDIDFEISGDLNSIDGEIKTLLTDFSVEDFKLYFEQGFPYLAGKAKTTKRDPDSFTGALVDVYLVLVSDEKDESGNLTGNVLHYGTFDENGEPNFRYQPSFAASISNFSSLSRTSAMNNDLQQENYSLTTNEGRLLKVLGISTDRLGETVTKVAADRVSQIVLDPIFDFGNKRIRRLTGLDAFQLSTRLRSNSEYTDYFGSFYNNPLLLEELDGKNTGYRNLYVSPELKVGKSLSKYVYLTYEGQYVTKIDNSNSEANIKGLSHIVALRWSMKNNIHFEFQYDYDFQRYFDQGDTRLWFRHELQLNGLKKKDIEE
ncbi:hypothetical protein ACFL7D_04575 [candidate division KSB1 bacterium]